MQIHKLEPPKKTFFYERSDGSIIEVGEREASKIHKKFKQVGVSDGKAFHQAVQEAHDLFNSEGEQAAKDRLAKGKEEELEIARGNLQIPGDFKVYGNGAAHLRGKV